MEMFNWIISMFSGWSSMFCLFRKVYGWQREGGMALHIVVDEKRLCIAP
jgi:D-arabinose 1-dehydrogenase-like Zn-dependent alcohol dehydrogenase